LRRFNAKDKSMQPAEQPRYRLLVAQLSEPRVCDIVDSVEPDRPRSIAVKRVAGVNDGVIEVRGDNLNVSRDSREFGPVPRNLVFGRAIYRYLPGSRRGRL